MAAPSPRLAPPTTIRLPESPKSIAEAYRAERSGRVLVTRLGWRPRIGRRLIESVMRSLPTYEVEARVPQLRRRPSRPDRWRLRRRGRNRRWDDLPDPDPGRPRGRG